MQPKLCLQSNSHLRCARYHRLRIYYNNLRISFKCWKIGIWISYAFGTTLYIRYPLTLNTYRGESINLPTYSNTHNLLIYPYFHTMFGANVESSAHLIFMMFHNGLNTIADSHMSLLRCCNWTRLSGHYI